MIVVSILCGLATGQGPAVAAAAVGVGACLLWQPGRLLALACALRASPLWALALGLLAAASVWFIFFSGKNLYS